MNGYLVENTAFLSENLPIGAIICGAMGLLLYLLCIRGEVEKSRGRTAVAVTVLCLALMLCGLAIWGFSAEGYSQLLRWSTMYKSLR